MNRHYLLNPDRSLRPATLMEWARAFEDTASRIVAKTFIGKGIEVSTVFLGLEHGQNSRGEPLVFETMIFNNNADESYCERYASWGEAEQGHKKAVALARLALERAS